MSPRAALRVVSSVMFLALSCSSPQRQPTVILVSIDGLRHDYIELADTPSFDRLIAAGVKAESLLPVFPADTFPNHYSVVTGLYPEHHGIVSNGFYDPELDATFGLTRPESLSDPRFWDGEPIWATAQKQGLVTASVFWGGTDVEIRGVRPTYWHPYDGSVPNETRVDTVLEWFDLPREERPSLVTLYMSLVDATAHDRGPESPEAVAAVREVDRALGRLIDGLRSRGIFDTVNLVIVSDHGLTSVSPDRVIYLDDLIEVNRVRIVDQGSKVALWPEPGVEDEVFEALEGADPHLHVFRKEEIPDRFHHRDHRRIPPILGLADEGWLVFTRDVVERLPQAVLGGAHGYDNRLASMHATFLAHGPAFARGVEVASFENVHIYELLAEVLRIEPAETDGDLDSVRHLLAP